MSVQVPTRFTEDEIAKLDRLVRDGVGTSRSDVIRIAFHQLVDFCQRRDIGESIAASYQQTPQSDEEFAWASHNAQVLTAQEF